MKWVQLFYYECKILITDRQQWLNGLLFFLVFVLLFAVVLGHEQAVLQRVSGALLWMALSITVLFSIDNLFRIEQEEGYLTQLLLSPYPLWQLILMKIIALWLVITIPLIICIPMLVVMMALPFSALLLLLLSFLIGALTVVAFCTMGTMLTLAISRSGMLLALLLMPLLTPVLILGESIVMHLLDVQGVGFQLYLLSALAVISLTVMPHLAAMILRISMDE